MKKMCLGAVVALCIAASAWALPVTNTTDSDGDPCLRAYDASNVAAWDSGYLYGLALTYPDVYLNNDHADEGIYSVSWNDYAMQAAGVTVHCMILVSDFGGVTRMTGYAFYATDSGRVVYLQADSAPMSQVSTLLRRMP